MKLQSVKDKSFGGFGYVLEGYDFNELLSVLEACSEKPQAGTIYIPGEPKLEALPVFAELRDRAFGGIPIQIGYCNGRNTRLNCLEYHRGSEILVAADELILLVARKQDMTADFKIDTSKVEAFTVPKGCGVLCYETTLHYAPAKADGSFRAVIILPRSTNTEKPSLKTANAEDKLLTARNKWLVAHPDSPEAKNGAAALITGTNIDVTEL